MINGEKRGNVVLVPYGSSHLALDPEDLMRALDRGGQLSGIEGADRVAAGRSEPATRKLVSAEVMSRLTGAPPSWFYERARRRAIPHVRLGKYVRFDAEAVLAFLKRDEISPEVPEREAWRA